MIERIIDEREFRRLCMIDDKINDHSCHSSAQCSYFFEKTYGANPPGWFIVWTKKGFRSFSISTVSNFDIVSEITDWRIFQDIYFSIGLRRRRPTNNILNNLEEVVALPGFWMTIPIQGPIHRQKNIPSSNSEALKFIKSRSVKPDIIIDTGYELQVHWNFEQLVIFDSNGHLNEIKQMSRDFQQEIINEGKKCRWQLSDTSSLLTKLRVPGTFNWTLYPPKPITILEPKENVWKFY